MLAEAQPTPSSHTVFFESAFARSSAARMMHAAPSAFAQQS
jgi:hypothetical protein